MDRTRVRSTAEGNACNNLIFFASKFNDSVPHSNQCVLSGIIVVALKGMYVQAAALPRFYREGKLEAISWVVTFIAVVLVDVDVGYVNNCPMLHRKAVHEL